MAGGLYPEMPFNQQLSIPVELKLKGTGASAVLTRQPVAELNALRGKAFVHTNRRISPGKPFTADTKARLFDVSFTVSTGSSKALYVMVRGQTLAFDWAEANLNLVNGRPHKLGRAEQSKCSSMMARCRRHFVICPMPIPIRWFFMAAVMPKP
jgi:sucrose-6-phosphate hydrolase SacC (GH32 family)